MILVALIAALTSDLEQFQKNRSKNDITRPGRIGSAFCMRLCERKSYFGACSVKSGKKIGFLYTKTVCAIVILVMNDRS